MTAPHTTTDATESPTYGYRGPPICRIIGITYRQLDYWATTGLVEPSVCKGTFSGSQRLYSVGDVVLLKVISRLLDLGVSLPRIRQVVDHIRGLPLHDLVFASDGKRVWEIVDERGLLDLVVRHGPLFAIAVGPLYEEIEAEMGRRPSEPHWPSSYCCASATEPVVVGS